VELAKQLGLSQARLSEIESGDGSFTAEQLLALLRLFNVPIEHFAHGAQGHDADLQNALARLGAHHLQESTEVLPSERLKEVGDVVRETLLCDSPRLLTALAPVVVRNGINLPRVHAQLIEAGLDRRLPWLIANAREAVSHELAGQGLLARWAPAYRRAEVVFGEFLRTLPAPPEGAPLDILDSRIRSPKTVQEVLASSSAISRRWRIVTRLQVKDFVRALREARVDR
jgi:transcriptional regulator with XRE-family HTH domain